MEGKNIVGGRLVIRFSNEIRSLNRFHPPGHSVPHLLKGNGTGPRVRPLPRGISIPVLCDRGIAIGLPRFPSTGKTSVRSESLSDPLAMQAALLRKQFLAVSCQVHERERPGPNHGAVSP